MRANPYLAALQWHLDIGVDEALQDAPYDRTHIPPELLRPSALFAAEEEGAKPSKPSALSLMPAPATMTGGELLGTAAARVEAVKLAAACNSLEDLREAIASFDGLSVKKTASNLVFADGNPQARVMLIGEAPGADEDRQGKPFVGASGQLLDRILACIGLLRAEEDPDKSVYISNILNWRPPGNRTPSPAEVDISLPFIERHIALVKPKVLILCGGVSAKGLLGSGESISRLRGKLHNYQPLTEGVADEAVSISAMATYHPAYLLRTPSQKAQVWADMLMLQAHLERN